MVAKPTPLPTGRGQSPVDFVVGFGVFFLAFTFVVALLPELLSPFAAPESGLVADRAAGTLAGELLASGTVGTLDETCTAEFFGSNGTSCSFDGGDPAVDIVGVDDRYDLNVTLESDLSGRTGEIACYDGSVVQNCSNATPLARGDSPPDATRSVRTAERVVRVDGETLLLRVRVW